MSKPAFYHRNGWQPKPCEIIAEHADGTVDLAAPGSTEAFVTHCRLVDQAIDGPEHDGVVSLDRSREQAEKAAAEKAGAEKAADKAKSGK